MKNLHDWRIQGHGKLKLWLAYHMRELDVTCVFVVAFVVVAVIGVAAFLTKQN